MSAISEHYEQRIEQLQAELEVAKDELEDLYSSAPCPKCGFGITSGCYGCEIKKLQAELKKLVEEVDLQQDAREKAEAEIERLKTAIRETLADNGHLADGDNCTLIKLKQALERTGQ